MTKATEMGTKALSKANEEGIDGLLSQCEFTGVFWCKLGQTWHLGGIGPVPFDSHDWKDQLLGWKDQLN